MPVSSEKMSVGDFREALEKMDADDDLYLMINGEYGPMGVYSLRKHMVTDEEGEDDDSYIIING